MALSGTGGDAESAAITVSPHPADQRARYAGFFARGTALVIDALIAAVVCTLIFAAVNYSIGPTFWPLVRISMATERTSTPVHEEMGSGKTRTVMPFERRAAIWGLGDVIIEGKYILPADERCKEKERILSVVDARAGKNVLISISLYIYSISLFIYGGIAESSRYMATLGKKFLGIYVSLDNGDRVEMLKSMIRNLLKVITLISVFGFVMLWFMKRKKMLHDLVLGSVVMDVDLVPFAGREERGKGAA